MKTLKKTLCLVLAVVMAVGVLVLPASAADYVDADEIENKEAAAVMDGLKVIEGNTEGEYMPSKELTRAEAAVIISRLMQTRDDSDDYVGSNVQFADVDKDNYAYDEIDYCVSEGIIVGDGMGNFLPGGELTGHAFAKMLLCALGYDADNEGFSHNDNWAQNVETEARAQKLNNGLKSFNYSKVITRDQAAQMAYNAMSVYKVIGYQGGTSITLPGGVTINQGATRNQPKDETGTTLKGDYGIVTLDDTTTDKKMDESEDALGRPNAYQIATSDGVLYTAKKSPVKIYTASAKAADVAKDLKGYTVATNVKVENDNSKDWIATAKVHQNGGEATVLTDGDNGKTTAAAIAGLTGNGVAVEIYASDKKEITDIVVVTKKLAKVKSTTSDKIELTVDSGTIIVENKENTANKDFFAALSNYAKDDYLMVAAKTDKTILEIADVQTVSGTLTAKGKGLTDGSKHSESYTIGGTKYTIAENEEAAWGCGNDPTPDASTEVTALLDQYGYLVDILAAKTAAPQYVYVVDVDREVGAWSAETRLFQGVLTDGTVVMGEYKFKGENDPKTYADENAVYSYSESDGVYTFDEQTDSKVVTVSDALDAKTNSKQLPGSSNFYASDVKTIFIKGSGDELTADLHDGLASFEAGTNNKAILNSNSYVSVIFVNSKAAVEYSTDLIYVPAGNTSANGSQLDDAGKPRNTFEVYLNGEKSTLMIASDSATISSGWFTYTVAADGYYTLNGKPADNTIPELTIKTSGPDKLEKGDGIYYITTAAEAHKGLNLADATNAKVVDLRSVSTKVTSVAELYDALGDNGLTVTASYNSNKTVVDMIYVLA